MKNIQQYEIKVVSNNDKSGNIENILFIWDSVEWAKEDAKSQGYQILSLDSEIKAVEYWKETKPLFYSKNISKKTVQLFFENFSNLRNIPISKKVDILKKQSRKYIMKLFFEDMQLQIMKWKSLYQFLSNEKWSRYFTHNQLELIRVWEQTDNLEKTLYNLSVEQKNELATKRAILSALIYPVIVLIATIMCWWILFFYVLPMIQEFVWDLDDLPPLTAILFWTKEFIFNYWKIVLFLSVSIIVAFTLSVRTTAWRYYYHKLLLLLPAIKLLVKARAEMQISKIVEFSSAAQMTPYDKVGLLKNGVDNLVYRNHFKNNHEKISTWNTLYSLFNDDKLFSLTLQAYIETWDINKNLDVLMLNHYENTLNNIHVAIHAVIQISMAVILILLAMVAIIFAGWILQLFQAMTSNFL